MRSGNKQVVEKRYPYWLEKIKSARIDKGYRLVTTRSGELSLEVEQREKGTFLHSRYDPRREARRIIEVYIKEKLDILVIGGFGLGYLVEVALEKTRKVGQAWEAQIGKVIVCDRDWGILKIALRERDLGEVLLNDKCEVVMTEDVERLMDILKKDRKDRLQLLVHQGSEQVYPEYYAVLRSAFINYQNQSSINRATLSRFEKLWMRNVRKNMLEFIRHKGVNSIEGKCRGEACVIVGAGPSLAKNIELLKECKERVLIIVVDTSFQILCRYGIEADFVVAIDPQEKNRKYFENVEGSKSVLVFETSISHQILRGYAGKKLVIGSLLHFVSWLEGITGRKGDLEIGGSVATACYTFALKLGCDPIIFIGLDLAYSNQETHMKGAYFEESWFYQSDRLKTPYSLSYRFLNQNRLFHVKGYDGGAVKTDMKLRAFQRWFEMQFERGDRCIINATEGGVWLDHCINKSFKEVIQEDIGYQKKAFEIDNLNDIEVGGEDAEKIMERVWVGLIGLCKRFVYLWKQVKKGLDLSKELYRLIDRRQGFKKVLKIQESLKHLDNLLTSDALIRGFISMPIQSVLSKVEKEEGLNAKEKGNWDLKAAKQSIFLYEGILEGLAFNIQELRKGELRLKNSLKGE